MLIDWLTIRHPINDKLGSYLLEKIQDCMGNTYCCNPDGSVKWSKVSLDIDKLRSDSPGLFWSITCDADSNRYISIGASPSSLEFGGVNVFGSLDIEYGAQVLLKHARHALLSILPDFQHWQCCRVDVTCNYDLGNAAQVKQGLRLLLATDAPRRRTNSDRKGGDTVYWNPSSDLRAGKAYHKGPQLRKQVRHGACECPEELLDKADNLLRLELKLGARWFRRLAKAWHCLTPAELLQEHQSFFGALIGEGLEVKDMGSLLKELEKACPTIGRALAAHKTFSLIKSMGYTQTKESSPDSTFRRHCADLRLAGISSAELCAGEIIPFKVRKMVIAEPVTWWDEIRRVA